MYARPSLACRLFLVTVTTLFCFISVAACTPDEIALYRAVVSQQSVHHMEPHLVCLRRHESDTSGGYRAVSASGTYRGAYQYSRTTWANHAKGSGNGAVASTDPVAVPPKIQDDVAYWGMQHNPTAWAGDHCGSIG